MTFLFARKPSHAALQAERLHDALVSVIRQPVFYLRLGVPDTFEGRFDLLLLHVALVLRRLRAVGPRGEAVAQHLVDTMFTRFDVALRELGVSDLGVPKRMKRMAEAFNGRTATYYAALDAADDDALTTAIERNVLGHAGGRDLASYVRRVVVAIAPCDLSAPGAALPSLPAPAEAP